jgi:hypothetical protein
MLILNAKSAWRSADAPPGPEAQQGLRERSLRASSLSPRTSSKAGGRMGKKKVSAWSPPADMSELHQLATEQQKLFRNLVQLKAEYDIELNDIFIFLGVGLLNYERSKAGPVPVQPVGISSVSEFLAMPKETVRRKLSRLEKKGLVTKTAYGFLVKEVEVWKSLAQAMNG